MRKWSANSTGKKGLTHAGRRSNGPEDRKSGVQYRGHLFTSQRGHRIWPHCVPWTAGPSDALPGVADGSRSKRKAAWGVYVWPADSFPPSKPCKSDRGHPSRAHQARPALQPLPVAKGHLHRKAQLVALPGVRSRLPIRPGSPSNRLCSAPQRPPQPGSRPPGVPHLLGFCRPWALTGDSPKTQTRGETGKLGSRGQAHPSPFGMSSQAAGDYWREPPSLGEDGRDAVLSGRPGA